MDYQLSQNKCYRAVTGHPFFRVSIFHRRPIAGPEIEERLWKRIDEISWGYTQLEFPHCLHIEWHMTFLGVGQVAKVQQLYPPHANLAVLF